MTFGSEFKDRQRATWTAGDFAEVARSIESSSTALVEAIGVSGGDDLLDVACGTGNSAIPAAGLGARVVGLDLTPKLVGIARARAAEEGLEIEFIEGDAEALPFEDGSFDRVISVFGSMFAPDHQQAAGEMVRVCRPGGRVGFCAWTPEGVNGRMFATLASYMPPPPAEFEPPILWGVEEHIRELLAPHGLEPAFERRSVTLEDDSIEDWMAFGESALGPMIMAKAALEPSGEWERARGDLVSLYEGANEGRDGSMRVQAEYLMTTVDLPA